MGSPEKVSFYTGLPNVAVLDIIFGVNNMLAVSSNGYGMCHIREF